MDGLIDRSIDRQTDIARGGAELPQVHYRETDGYIDRLIERSIDRSIDR